MRFQDATRFSTVKNKAGAPPRSAARDDDATSRNDTFFGTGPAYIQTLAPMGVYLAIFAITYAVELIVPFMFSDDYPALAAAMQGNLGDEVHVRLLAGRPVLALLFELVFGAVYSLGGMRLGRLVGIVSVAVLAWLLYTALLRAKIDRRVAFLLPILIGTLPTFQVYVSWSIASIGVLACIWSGVAVFAADAAAQHLALWRDTASRRRTALRMAGYGGLAVVLLLAGLATAQSTGLYYWVFVAIFLVAWDRGLPDLLMRCVVYFVVAVIAMGIEFVLVQALARSSGGYFARDTLVGIGAFPAKIRWFLTDALYSSLNLYELKPHLWIAVPVAIFTLCGLWLYVRGGTAERVVKLVVALALLPLGYTANLVIAENWASYRTQISLSSLVTLYGGLAVVGVVRSIPGVRAQAQRITTAILATACAFACFAAATSVALEFALPNYMEFNLVVRQLHSQSLQNKHSIYFIQPSWSDSPAPVVRFDEFGLPSSYAAWVPAPMMYVAMSQVDPADENLPVIIARAKSDGSVPAPPPNSIVVDMRQLRDYSSMSLCIAGLGYCH